MDTREETACPACSEMILATAKKCKHCGEWTTSHRDIPDLGSPSDTEPAEQPEAPTLVEVTVERPWKWGGGAMSFTLLLDDSSAATIGNGKEVSFKVPQGTHALSAKAFGYSAAPYTLDTRGLKAVRIAVSSGGMASDTITFSEVSRVRTASTDKAASVQPAQPWSGAAALRRGDGAAAATDPSSALIGVLAVIGAGFMLWSMIQTADLETTTEPQASCTYSDAIRKARAMYTVSGGSITIREINQSGTTCQASFVFNFGSYADADVVYWTP